MVWTEGYENLAQIRLRFEFAKVSAAGHVTFKANVGKGPSINLLNALEIVSPCLRRALHLSANTHLPSLMDPLAAPFLPVQQQLRARRDRTTNRAWRHS